MSTNTVAVDNKPGESWTVLANENDVTYSLPIFLGIGGQLMIISRITVREPVKKKCGKFHTWE